VFVVVVTAVIVVSIVIVVSPVDCEAVRDVDDVVQKDGDGGGELGDVGLIPRLAPVRAENIGGVSQERLGGISSQGPERPADADRYPRNPGGVLTLFWSAKHSTRTVAVPSAQGRTVRAQGPDGPWPGARRGGIFCAGADCPRPGAGRSAAWCAAEASLPDGRTVRTLGPDGPRVRRGGGSRQQRLDLAPGRDPVGEERS
jgi:hypothetical protein